MVPTFLEETSRELKTNVFFRNNVKETKRRINVGEHMKEDRAIEAGDTFRDGPHEKKITRTVK